MYNGPVKSKRIHYLCNPFPKSHEKCTKSYKISSLHLVITIDAAKDIKFALPAGWDLLLYGRKEIPMTIIYMDGVYHVNAESTDSTELIKEMALAIHQLSQDNAPGDHKTPTFEIQGGKPEYS